MPLFIDLHFKAEGKNFFLDLQKDYASQEKFGVTIKNIWLNREREVVFCLMEAPDIEVCYHVHQEVYNDLAFNIFEVSGGSFNNNTSLARETQRPSGELNFPDIGPYIPCWGLNPVTLD